MRATDWIVVLLGAALLVYFVAYSRSPQATAQHVAHQTAPGGP